ncbi:hypothetical protein [Bradyrhizobium arachidis]|uniref:hypothetical protein n=1 Tax=Bradyrhizobium arachidis TaxID=858423 RepID=UPI00216113D8|nr:hypothetical protein [Bradyrhizobium arachidis]
MAASDFCRKARACLERLLREQAEIVHREDQHLGLKRVFPDSPRDAWHGKIDDGDVVALVGDCGGNRLAAAFASATTCQSARCSSMTRRPDRTVS